MNKNELASYDDDRLSWCDANERLYVCSFHTCQAHTIDGEFKLLYSVMPLHRYCMWCGKDSQNETSNKSTI